MNSVHTDDVAGALWACAQWMAPLGREEADKRAGELIVFHNPKNKDKDIPFMQPHDVELKAPVFNIVSRSKATSRMHERTNNLTGGRFESHSR